MQGRDRKHTRSSRRVFAWSNLSGFGREDPNLPVFGQPLYSGVDLENCSQLPRVLVASVHQTSNGPKNLRVGTTPADVATQIVTHGFVGGFGLFCDQGLDGEHHPGRTEAALKSLILQKGLLHWVKLAVNCKALDGQYVPAFDVKGQQ